MRLQERDVTADSGDGTAVVQLETARGEGVDGRPTDDELLAIQTVDLHKSFGSHQVMRGCNLKVPEGTISVVLGPSGTGKSVMLRHIIGIMRADRGDVLVRGRSLNHMSRSEVLGLRKDIGVMFQDGALFSAMNVYENVAFPLRQHTDLAEQEIREIVLYQLKAVGLEQAQERYAGELSGGMRKRAGLARSLVLDPGILLCDEPDSGLDPVRTALLGELLIERHEECGGTVLVVTHNMALARIIADHISVVWRGQIVAEGSTDAMLNSNDEFVQQFISGEVEGPLGMDQ
jgi:phospholipid/cholesterol/gamma-HCH transport system ATP-binding protein